VVELFIQWVAGLLICFLFIRCMLCGHFVCCSACGIFLLTAHCSIPSPPSFPLSAQAVPGLKYEVLQEPNRTPLIFIEVPATGGEGGTVLMLPPSFAATASTFLALSLSRTRYGHMDKQPPMTAAWSDGLHPYTPIVRDGKLYGRGGADDGEEACCC
jgi:hypothetical protein